jgi:tetratricopeptide (TPR) repeat protein
MNVIPMKLDAEKEGVGAAKKYSIRAYPTILFLNKNGKEIARTAGFRDKEDVILTIKKNCDDPRTLDSLKAEFTKNPEDLVLAATIAKKLISADDKATIEEAKSVLEKIFKADPENKKGVGAQALVDRFAIGLEDLDNVEIRLRSLENVRKVLNKDITLLWDEEPIKLKDLDTAFKMLSSGASKHFAEIAAPNLKDVLGKVEALKDADVDIRRLMEFEDMYIRGADNPDLRELSNLYFDIVECFAKESNNMNEIAWYNYRLQRKLEESANLASKASELKKDPNCLDTLAHILMSRGMKEKAMEKEKEAIEILKKSGDAGQVEILSKVLSLFEKDQLDQLAPGVEPMNKELKRAEE